MLVLVPVVARGVKPAHHANPQHGYCGVALQWCTDLTCHSVSQC